MHCHDIKKKKSGVTRYIAYRLQTYVLIINYRFYIIDMCIFTSNENHNRHKYNGQCIIIITVM